MKPRILICMVLAMAMVLASAGSLLAAVAANTRIVNQATLTYDDGTGTRTATANVTVTVALVPGAPGLDQPPDASTAYAGPGTTLTFVYTVTAGGNGPDTYTITTSVTGSTNTTGPGASAPATVTLGATITTSGSTVSVLRVPSDGSADSSVNGIEVGNTVLVNGQVRTVTAISDPAAGFATITLNSPLPAAPAAGVPVYEQQQFSVVVDSGTIVTGGSDITVTVDTTAASSAGSDTDQVVATFTSGSATLTKYVRNLSWAAGNTGGTGATSITVNGTTYDYYTGGVKGRPGDVLQYVLVAANTSSAAVGNSTITDVLPTAYVTFKPDVYAATGDVIYIDETGTEHQLTQEADSDQATYASGTLTVHVGAGSNSSGGGSIPAGVSVTVAYQVTINP